MDGRTGVEVRVDRRDTALGMPGASLSSRYRVRN